MAGTMSEMYSEGIEIYAIDCRNDGVEDYQRKDRIGEERREGKGVCWLLGKWAQQSKFTHTTYSGKTHG